MRSLRVEPGTVARHASNLAGIANDVQTVSAEETVMGGVPQVSLLM